MKITPIIPQQRNVWQPRRPTNEEIAARVRFNMEQIRKEKKRC